MTAHLRYTGWEGGLERGNPVLELSHPCPQTAAAMATLYPSLEDMKGHQVLQAQAAAGVRTPATTVVTEKPKLTSGTEPPVLYPNLAELENYMGLALSSEEIQKNLRTEDSTALTPAGPSPGQLVAPLSGNNAGLRRAEIKPGVREIHLCKDERGKTGLQLKNVDQVRGWAGTGLGMAGNSVSLHKRDSRAQRDMAVYHGTATRGVKCHSAAQHGRAQAARHGTPWCVAWPSPLCRHSTVSPGHLRAAGEGQLASSAGGAALRGPGAADRRQELRGLEQRQGTARAEEGEP